MKSFNQLLEQSMHYVEEQQTTSADMRPATLFGYNVNTPANSPESFFQQRGITKRGTGLVDRAKMGGDKLINVIDKNKTAIAGGLATVIGGSLLSKFFPQGGNQNQSETEFDTTTQRRMKSNADVRNTMASTAPPTSKVGEKTAQASSSRDRIKIAPTKFNTTG